MPGSRAQSEMDLMPGSQNILQNFHRNVILNFLRVLDVFLEILSDSKNHVGFLVDEISELGHTINSLCSRHLENFRLSPAFRYTDQIPAESLIQN